MRSPVVLGMLCLSAAMVLSMGCGKEGGPCSLVAPHSVLPTEGDSKAPARWIQYGINRLSVATTNMQSEASVEDTTTVDAILQKLSDEECDILARGYIIQVNDPEVVSEICLIAGFHPGHSLAPADGLLMKVTPASWGQIKELYVPKKKKDG